MKEVSGKMNAEEIRWGIELLNRNIEPYRLSLVLATAEDPVTLPPSQRTFEKSLEALAELKRRITESFQGWVVKFNSWGIALYKLKPYEFRQE
jgi:hypothetical protein